MAIPLFATSLARYQPEVAGKLAQVAESGRWILGPEVEEFEREFARYLGVEHCIGVGNGTDAIMIALRALGVEPGDEVIVPSFTFYATAEAVVNAGATPVFCDIDPETFCVTAETVEPKVTERTRAIVPVHLFGNVAPVDELRRFGRPVLEDAAQAAGARQDLAKAGSLGSAATFSFFPSKNLPCLGDGGAIVTDHDAIADRARRLRFHGSRDKATFTEVGYNSRLDELQAGVLRVFLNELDGWNRKRRATAVAYERLGLADVPGMRLPAEAPGAEHVYHLYVTRHPEPAELERRLKEKGIGARRYYTRPVHLQPSMERFGGASLDLPGTAEAARTNLALPMGTDLTEEQLAEVVAACASG
ncbi:MAG: DegT/DnrJ/EryC1/StrS family aminotransferase [Thermoleophilaceae bacterium]